RRPKGPRAKREALCLLRGSFFSFNTATEATEITEVPSRSTHFANGTETTETQRQRNRDKKTPPASRWPSGGRAVGLRQRGASRPSASDLLCDGRSRARSGGVRERGSSS